MKIPAGGLTVGVLRGEDAMEPVAFPSSTGVTLAAGVAGTVSGDWTGESPYEPAFGFLRGEGGSVDADWTQSRRCPPPGWD